MVFTCRDCIQSALSTNIGSTLEPEPFNGSLSVLECEGPLTNVHSTTRRHDSPHNLDVWTLRSRRDFLSSILVVVQDVFVFVFTSNILQGCCRFPHHCFRPAQKHKTSPRMSKWTRRGKPPTRYSGFPAWWPRW